MSRKPINWLRQSSLAEPLEPRFLFSATVDAGQSAETPTQRTELEPPEPVVSEPEVDSAESPSTTEGQPTVKPADVNAPPQESVSKSEPTQNAAAPQTKGPADAVASEALAPASQSPEQEPVAAVQRLEQTQELIEQNISENAADPEYQREITRALLNSETPDEQSERYQSTYKAVGNALIEDGPRVEVTETASLPNTNVPTSQPAPKSLPENSPTEPIESTVTDKSESTVSESPETLETPVEAEPQYQQTDVASEEPVKPSVAVDQAPANPATTVSVEQQPEEFNVDRTAEGEKLTVSENASSDTLEGASASSDANVNDLTEPMQPPVQPQQPTDEMTQRLDQPTSSPDGIYVLPENVHAAYDPATETALVSQSLATEASDGELADALREEYGEHIAELVSRRTGQVYSGDVGDRVGAVLGGQTAAEAIAGETPGTLETLAVVDGQVTTVRAMTGSSLVVSASGDEGGEQFNLIVGGQTVASYTATTSLQEFTYQAAGAVSLGDVRVEFTNDQYDPSIGLDANLNVPKVALDGTDHFTNDPSVFSTGTWADGGIVPGFGRGETLHGNGYFQYADSPPSGGSSVTVRASGDLGSEQFRLLIGQQEAATFTVSSQFDNYVYQSPTTVAADDVRVEFFNDQFDPGTGIDANLNVAHVDIDGVVYATNDPRVFSTGTWLDGGVEPGFGRGETLHINGYFQYADQAPGGGSRLTVRASGDEGGEQFRLLLDGQVAETFAVTTALDNYVYQSTDTITPDQVRVEFINDQYDPAAGIDANLNVPSITIDGQTLLSNDPSVFSTGTWLPEDGLAPGFGRGETLHGNGYFQYAATGGDSGFFSLATNVINVGEQDGSASVTVNRSSGGSATIQYQVLEGTATAGDDFEISSGTLTFAEGETSQAVSIPIVDDAIAESNETIRFAIDSPTGAGLLVPRTATITITDNDGGGQFPSFANFANTSGLTLNGTATSVAGGLQLTSDNGQIEVGTAFYDTAIAITPGTSFQTEFSFEIDGGGNGADGLAFVLQNDPQGTSAIGGAGGGIGFAEINNSVAIKFDTYQNTGEISSNLVGVNTGGNFVANASATITSGDLNDGSVRRAFIDYNGESNRLAVFLSDDANKPETPVLVTDVDLAAEVGSQAFVGFTAATGGLSNTHRILDWQFDDSVPPPVDPPPENLIQDTIRSGLIQPTSIDFSPDGRNLYIAEKSGRINVQRDGNDAGVVVDLTAQVNDTRDRGLIDIAIHPDLVNNPYLYAFYTYDPPEVFDNPSHELAGPDKNGNRAGRLSRFTLDASTGYTRVVAGSESVILGTNSTWDNFNGFANSTNDFNEPPAGILPDGSNLRDFIASDSESHTVGAVEFAPDGALIVSTGDGTSYNRADPRTVRVLDQGNLSGKILRIDPITGNGYSDNPFFDGDLSSNQSKVYQLGLRNPFRISVDSANGRVYVGDVGWTQWEEINFGAPGANFGWPFYEGGDNGNLRTGEYEDFPEAADFYANQGSSVQAPLTAFSHPRDGAVAIVLGDVYRGSAYPSRYQGDLFFTDFGQGIVRNANLDANGNISSIETFATDAQVVSQIITGPDGNLYFASLGSGTVGRWRFE